jgi:hypothetical protein
VLWEGKFPWVLFFGKTEERSIEKGVQRYL